MPSLPLFYWGWGLVKVSSEKIHIFRNVGGRTKFESAAKFDAMKHGNPGYEQVISSIINPNVQCIYTHDQRDGLL